MYNRRTLEKLRFLSQSPKRPYLEQNYTTGARRSCPGTSICSSKSFGCNRRHRQHTQEEFGISDGEENCEDRETSNAILTESALNNSRKNIHTLFNASFKFQLRRKPSQQCPLRSSRYDIPLIVASKPECQRYKEPHQEFNDCEHKSGDRLKKLRSYLALYRSLDRVNIVETGPRKHPSVPSILASDVPYRVHCEAGMCIPSAATLDTGDKEYVQIPIRQKSGSDVPNIQEIEKESELKKDIELCLRKISRNDCAIQKIKNMMPEQEDAQKETKKIITNLYKDIFRLSKERETKQNELNNLRIYTTDMEEHKDAKENPNEIIAKHMSFKNFEKQQKLETTLHDLNTELNKTVNNLKDQSLQQPSSAQVELEKKLRNLSKQKENIEKELHDFRMRRIGAAHVEEIYQKMLGVLKRKEQKDLENLGEDRTNKFSDETIGELQREMEEIEVLLNEARMRQNAAAEASEIYEDMLDVIEKNIAEKAVPEGKKLKAGYRQPPTTHPAPSAKPPQTQRKSNKGLDISISVPTHIGGAKLTHAARLRLQAQRDNQKAQQLGKTQGKAPGKVVCKKVPSKSVQRPEQLVQAPGAVVSSKTQTRMVRTSQQIVQAPGAVVSSKSVQRPQQLVQPPGSAISSKIPIRTSQQLVQAKGAVASSKIPTSMVPTSQKLVQAPGAVGSSKIPIKTGSYQREAACPKVPSGSVHKSQQLVKAPEKQKAQQLGKAPGKVVCSKVPSKSVHRQEQFVQAPGAVVSSKISTRMVPNQQQLFKTPGKVVSSKISAKNVPRQDQPGTSSAALVCDKVPSRNVQNVRTSQSQKTKLPAKRTSSGTQPRWR